MNRILRSIAVTFSAGVLSATTLAAGGGGAVAPMAKVDPNKHFDPLGKPPSKFTLEAIRKDSADLPFDDTRDFDEAR